MGSWVKLRKVQVPVTEGSDAGAAIFMLDHCSCVMLLPNDHIEVQVRTSLGGLVIEVHGGGEGLQAEAKVQSAQLRAGPGVRQQICPCVCPCVLHPLSPAPDTRATAGGLSEPQPFAPHAAYFNNLGAFLPGTIPPRSGLMWI